MDNTYGEKKILVQLDYLTGKPSEGTNMLYDKYQCDLCQYKTNVHISFYNQTLVSTGFISTDLNATSTDIFYGGDIYLTPYWFYAVSLWNTFKDTVLLNVFLNDPKLKLWFKTLWEKLFYRNNSSIDSTEITQIKDKVLPDGELHFEYVESRDNINWRKAGELYNQLIATEKDAKYESTYPKYIFENVTRPVLNRNIDVANPSSTLLYFQDWLDFYTTNDNNIFFFFYHSQQNKLKPVFPKQNIIDCDAYNDRVIRSSNNTKLNFKQ